MPTQVSHGDVRLPLVDTKSFLPDSSEWTWPDADKNEWRLESGNLQEFYKNWHNKSTDLKFPTTFPYKLSLGVNSRGISLAPYCRDWQGGQILVTKAYDEMFHRLLRLRKDDRGSHQGAVITGQSGIGASPSVIRSPPRATTHGHVQGNLSFYCTCLRA